LGDRGYNEEGTELVPRMIELRTFLIFDFMCWQARRESDLKSSLVPEGTAIFSDIGWRPLLKVAISRTNDWWAKRNALKLFHQEYDYLSKK